MFLAETTSKLQGGVRRLSIPLYNLCVMQNYFGDKMVTGLRSCVPS